MSKGKSVAIVQSNYIPWRGYFDLINTVDEFVLFDHVQYTRRDWRNRNRIKTPQGSQWLSIPVEVKGGFHQSISETRVSDPNWAEKHWKTICLFYGRAPFFDDYRALFEGLYRDCNEVLLSRINYRFLTAICGVLGIDTRVTWSSDYEIATGKSECLVAICRQLKATEYVSGLRARAYLDEEVFEQAEVNVRWMDYSGYAEYRQLYQPFDPAVSIVDLIFNEGPLARSFLKTTSDQQ